MSSVTVIRDGFYSGRSSTPAPRAYRPREDCSTTAASAETIRRLRDAQAFCDELAEAISEAASDGWDGPGSKAYDVEALDKLLSFVDALPKSFPFPAVSVAASGKVVLEWPSFNGTSLVCTVDKGGRVNYSLLHLGQQVYGSFDFAGDQLPPEFGVLASRWWRSIRYAE